MTSPGWQVGDRIGLPPEPGVGSVLRCRRRPGNPFTICHGPNGWFAGSGAYPVPWWVACVSWGPWAGEQWDPFEVVTPASVDPL